MQIQDIQASLVVVISLVFSWWIINELLIYSATKEKSLRRAWTWGKPILMPG